jgi:hypothetical protein
MTSVPRYGEPDSALPSNFEDELMKEIYNKQQTA